VSANVKGVFKHLDLLVNAIDRLQTAGYGKMEVASPLPRHEIEELLYKGRPSPVRWWTMTGGLIGSTGGFLIASLTSAVWPMTLPGGKPVVSIPPFMIIVFECTVLLGGLFTLLGLLYHCRLPTLSLSFDLQDPRYSSDCFGVVLEGLDEENRRKAADIMRDAGAIEVADNIGDKEAVNA
jgi:molybdopterin-containing oxidoreductase family membrane subunit